MWSYFGFKSAVVSDALPNMTSAAKFLTQPNCPICNRSMLLVRIELAGSGVHQRTFRCNCGHTESLLVEHKRSAKLRAVTAFGVRGDFRR
jgi:transposase-like protein